MKTELDFGIVLIVAVILLVRSITLDWTKISPVIYNKLQYYTISHCLEMQTAYIVDIIYRWLFNMYIMHLHVFCWSTRYEGLLVLNE